MDELVADLSSALDRTNDPPSAHSDTTIGTRESPSATPVRKAPKKRRGRKRRSDYPPLRERPKASAESNDSVEEALMDYIENISMCQSDSEDETSFTKRLLRVQLHGRENPDPYPLPEKEKGESDSVSDPLVGLTKRRKKRKRKLKRVSGSQSLNDRDSPLGSLGNLKSLSRTRKRKVCGKSAMGSEVHNSLKRRDEEGSLADIENGLSSGCGEPMETCGSSNHFYKLPSRLHMPGRLVAKPSDLSIAHSSTWLHHDDCDEKMLITRPESYKIDLSSSGESDLEGFFTNDEGRLGDDEKEESSFECDVRINPWWEERSASDIEEDKFQSMVNGVMDEYRRPMVSGCDGKGGLGLQARLKKNPKLPGQESTMGDINRNIAIFLQNEKWTELSVFPSNKLERAQVYQWASLYSLQCQADPVRRGRVLLCKTSCPSPPRHPNRPEAETKRRRKMPPQICGPHSTVGGDEPIPPSNIGNQMLRIMGWTPGTGLGTDRNGIKDPVRAYLRPKGLGLGHPWPS